MTLPDDLLEIACRRIADLDAPAYVKNSELRYVAVNAAYAAFFGRAVSDFIGMRSREIFDGPGEEAREDKERRALVFAEEESALCIGPDAERSRRVEIESFSTGAGGAYILGIFAPEKSASGEGAAGPRDPSAAHRMALLAATLDRLPVPVFLRDSACRMVYANAAHREAIGLTPTEEPEREPYFGADAADAERLAGHYAALLQEGGVVEVETALRRRDGELRPILKRLGQIRLADGARYIVGTFSDMQAVKQREMALEDARRISEAHRGEIQTILDSVPIGLLLLDADYTIVYLNRHFGIVWDMSDEGRFIGRPYGELVAFYHSSGLYGPDVTAREILERRKRDFAEGRPVTLGWDNGKCVVSESRRLPDGQLLVSFCDVTEMRDRDRQIDAAKAELHKLGELMQDALAAMPQGMLILEAGQILLSNSQVSSILDIPAAMVEAGKSWVDAYDFGAARGDHPEGTLGEWRDKIAAGLPINHDFQIDEKRWVKMESATSQRGRWVSLFTDITEAKAREAELAGLLSRAEAADRAKSEFLANMSHEIRTPMNGVLGMAELLSKTELDTRQKTFVDVIVKSGNALLTIINDILDFSKIDAGQLTLHKTNFSLVEAVEDVATLLSAQATDKGLELLVRAAPDLPAVVVGDAGRFRQIVTNLVGNAIKFTERGHVFIDLDLATGGEAEAMIRLRVEDTGIGIPASKLETIFDKFSQVDGSSTRRHEGAGLGLAITSALVDLFGGYIEVQSLPGEGSVFSVNLPLPVALAKIETARLPLRIEGARVLVIDDNAVNRAILVEQLTSWGFDAAACDNGRDGLAVLRAAIDLGLDVDAVVLDYHMPDMNGADVARVMHEQERLRDIPIVFLTSMDISDTEKEIAALNGQAHLMKPARSETLRATIIEVVRTNMIRRIGESGLPVAPKAPPKRVVQPAAALDVLVAEDNDVNQIVFRQILQGTGLSFLIVGDGAAAVEAWESRHPRLIMMDVSMPVMNGHDATREIRRREAGTGGHVPIVGVTAHALESDHALCLQAGMDDYLAKPISPELLEGKIAIWLNGGASQPGRSEG